MSDPMSTLRIRALAVLSVLFLSTLPVGVARADMAAPPPEGPAQAWLVADLDSGQILAARDPYATHAPASTIKVLLALVALDEVPMDATVVADAADAKAECNCVGIKAGQTYTARELLDAALLESGNDAANTLAHLLGGRQATVDKMNAKAAALGATSTHTDSPSGLDAPGMDMRTSPRDLAVIFRAALANPVFAEITAQPNAPFPGRGLHNQNELMYRYPGVIGGKTGFTDIARKTYVVAAERDGKRLVVSMMYGLVHEGGPTYWDQAASLFDWGFVNDGSSSVGSL
ncbi:D-alanyl-D-alanine carboxypeptidase family protein [Mycobacteroides abscessus]|uniref:D-alanyl-D-alanine carboxypeptidase family protein n=1 Tax=Mycobacteroides abscessus TaxID=36809 RepID=UPI0009A8B44A|nr:D-alanyl-D-alanine carboxypeptidase family protein [Mycobacteroides abscessus]